jgi:hypothetical protein
LRNIPSHGKVCRVYSVEGKEACHFEDYPSDLEALEFCPIWTKEYKPVIVIEKEVAWLVMGIIGWTLALFATVAFLYMVRLFNRTVERLCAAEDLRRREDRRPIIRFADNVRIARGVHGWEHSPLDEEPLPQREESGGGAGGSTSTT